MAGWREKLSSLFKKGEGAEAAGTAPVAPAASEAAPPDPTQAAGSSGFTLRFLARWIDGNLLIILGLFAALSLKLPAALVNILLPLIYFGVLHGIGGQTLGKKILRIRLVEMQGGKVSFLKAFARAAADYLNVITLGVGYIMAAFTSKKQALHDIVCSTRVVYVAPCPIWVGILSAILPPVAWGAVIFTVGMSMIAMVAGPLMFFAKQGVPIQPNININVTAAPAASDETAQQEEEKMPEEEEFPPTEPAKEPAAAKAPVTPAPSAPQQPPAAAETQAQSPVAPETAPPSASATANDAVVNAVTAYLRKTKGDITDLKVTAETSEMRRRAIATPAYSQNNKNITERYLVINLSGGWQVIRKLGPHENLDWSTGKIQKTR
ncbi:MAG: RDD family protein [Elusimicrobia bacterium]|nr:RDD family protein [Elusimicrobiota bacterium]